MTSTDKRPKAPPPLVTDMIDNTRATDPLRHRTVQTPQELRRQAEETLQQKTANEPKDLAPMTAEETQRVLHELRVHQIELEMQNEELRQAQVELDAMRARYFDLYDLALVGYCTISEQGMLLEVNLTAANLLGVVREKNAVKPIFSQFIHKEDHAIYYLHRKQLLATGELQVFELRMVKSDGTTFWAQLVATAARDANGSPVCRVAIIDITKRKQAEKALSIINEDLKESQRIAHVGSWRLDIASNEVIWSDELYKMYGFDPALPPPPYTEHQKLFTPESWNRLSTELANTRDTGVPYELELQTVREDGSHGWMWVHGEAIVDAKGVTVSLRGADQDITDRKRAEDVLQKSEKQYRLIAENMSDVISVMDMNFRFTYVSPSIQRLTGFTVDEAVKHSIEEIITPESLQNVLNVFEEEMMLEASGTADPSRNRIIEIEQSKKDISIVWVEVACSFIRDAGKKPTGILLISRDITKRKRAEADRERLMVAIGQAGETIVITDPGGMIQYVNPAFEKVSGYSRDEVMGQSPRILKSGRQDDIFYQQLWETISSGKTWSGRMINKKKDGTLYTEDATISPVCDAAGRIVNYVAVKRDVTEHLRLSDQLQQAQKMESVGRLAGGVAHDYNNALAVIIGFTEMAMEQMDPALPIYADLEEVLAAAKRAADITRQLLAFARKQTIAPTVIELNKNVGSMLNMLRRLIGEDIDLAWLPGKDPGLINIDPSQIDQMLANLCVNARDAIADVGKITIETGPAVFDEDYCAEHTGFVPGEFVLLAVSDDGCGMDRETLAQVFEPFFTTKGVGEGTGLGLSTIYGIVKQNNGFVNVYSEPGQGTTFKIYLPRHVGKPGQIQEEGPAEPDERGHEIILLVEDEPSILKMTTRMLGKLGYTVLPAGTPGEAIRLAEAYAGQVHLLMTDVVMPEMNGRDLAKNLLSLYPNLNRLFMSGYTANVIAHHGVLDKGVNFIQKPFSKKDLAVKIREALE